MAFLFSQLIGDSSRADDFAKRRARIGKFRRVREELGNEEEKNEMAAGADADEEAENSLSDWETISAHQPQLHGMLAAEVDVMMSGPIGDGASIASTVQTREKMPDCCVSVYYACCVQRRVPDKSP